LPLVAAADWNGSYRRSEVRHVVPDAILTDASGKSFSLAQELAAEGPVVLNFFSMQCGDGCEALNRTLAEVEGKPLSRRAAVRVISIAAEPRTRDTPTRLRALAKEAQAGPGWMVLSGYRHDLGPLLEAFGIEDRTVRNTPVLFLHAGPAAPWVRIDGPVSSAQILSELH
jgi:cytochrome oxidase Cu insertion factor (SCO1/SenC/PrrC family)